MSSFSWSLQNLSQSNVMCITFQFRTNLNFPSSLVQKRPPEVFLKISQNSQENTCVRVTFLVNLQASCLQRPATLLKTRLWHRCSCFTFVNFLRTPFLQNSSKRLLPSVANVSFIFFLLHFWERAGWDGET